MIKKYLITVVCFLLLACNYNGSSGSDNNSENIDASAFTPAIVAPKSVVSGHTVHLIANSSISGLIPEWSWIQLAGTEVELENAFTGNASFSAPFVNSTVTLVFELTGTVGNVLKKAQVSIDVHPETITVSAGKDFWASPGNTVSLHAEASTDGDIGLISYHWEQTSGDSVVLNNPNTTNPSFTAPAAGGTLSFSVTASDPNGISSTDSVTVIIAGGSATLIYSSGRSVGYTGETQSIGVNVDGTYNDISFQWLQVAGPSVTLSSHSEQNVSFTSPDVTEKTLLAFRVTATDSSNRSATTYVDFTVYPVPVALPLIIDAGQDKSELTEDTVSLAVEILQQGTGNLTYQWTQTSGPEAVIVSPNSQQTDAILRSDSGYAVFKIEVSDGTATVTDSVTVYAEALAASASVIGSAAASAGNTSYVGDTIHLHASVTNAKMPVAYYWEKVSGSSDLSSQSDHDVSTTPSATGEAIYAVTVTDDLSRTASAYVKINVIDRPVPIQAILTNSSNLTIVTSKGSTLTSNTTYEGDTVTASVAYSGEAAAPSIHWSELTGAGVTLSDNTQSSVSFSAPAVAVNTPVSLTVTVDDGVVQRSDQVDFLIQDRPVSIKMRDDIISYVGKTQSLSAQASGGLTPLNYAWSQVSGPALSINNSNQAAASFTPSVSGKYAFKLTVTDSIGNVSNSIVYADISGIPVPAVSATQSMSVVAGPPISFLEGQQAGASIAVLNANGTPVISWTVADTGGTSITNADLAGTDQSFVSFAAPIVDSKAFITLRADVTDNDSTQTRNITITINNRNLQVTTSPRDITVGLSETAYFHGNLMAPNAVSPVIWQWLETVGPLGGLFENSDTDNPSFTALASGQFVFEATATDALGNTDSDTVNLTVNDDLSITLDNSDTGIDAVDFPDAYGDNVISLHGYATKGSGSYTYAWSAEAYDFSSNSWISQSTYTGTHFPVEFTGGTSGTNTTVQLSSDAFTVPSGSTFCEKQAGKCEYVKARATLTVTDNSDFHTEFDTVEFEWLKPYTSAAPVTALPQGTACSDVTGAGATGNEGYQAYQCLGPKGLCEVLHLPAACPAGTIPAVEISNSTDMTRLISMGCMSVNGDGSVNTGGLPTNTNCMESWYKKYSSNILCTDFQFDVAYNLNFYCVICTVGDLSNFSPTGCGTPGPRWSP